MESDGVQPASNESLGGLPQRLAFFNGSWIAPQQAVISVNDPAVTHAATAVERIRVYGEKPFQFDAHLDRWEKTTSTLAIEGLPGRTELEELVDRLLVRNRDWAKRQQNYGVLMFASAGVSAIPTLLIDLYPIDSKLHSKRIELGSPLVITNVQQPSSRCWPRDIKVRCRLHYYLAQQQATPWGCDSLGVLLDADGTITETAIANILVVENNTVVSPPLDQILPGVSLSVVRDLCQTEGLSWAEQRIRPARLKAADEVLLTGTSCGIWFANAVDHTRLCGKTNVYRRLRDGFDRLIQES